MRVQNVIRSPSSYNGRSHTSSLTDGKIIESRTLFGIYPPKMVVLVSVSVYLFCHFTHTKIFGFINGVEGLTLETSAFRISVRWPIYIINSVDKTKNFCILLPHRRSTTVSLETTPSFILHIVYTYYAK